MKISVHHIYSDRLEGMEGDEAAIREWLIHNYSRGILRDLVKTAPLAEIIQFMNSRQIYQAWIDRSEIQDPQFPLDKTTRVSFERNNFKNESLIKSQKDADKMYKPDSPGAKTKKEHLTWAYKLPNENWSLWTVRHHRDKPEDFTPEVKSTIEHFAGMQHAPEIANLRFDKSHDLPTGLKMMQDAEESWRDRTRDKLGLLPAHSAALDGSGERVPAKKMLDFGDGTAWWDLGVQYCTEEGRAMLHCGNEGDPQKGDTVWSLRSEREHGGHIYYEPHATFIRNGDTFTEMKGRENHKPGPEYHDRIAKLFEHTGFLPVGGGYMPQSNFSLEDLPQEQRDAIEAKHPALRVFRTGEGTDEEFEQLINKGPKALEFVANTTKNPQIIQKTFDKLAGNLINTEKFYDYDEYGDSRQGVYQEGNGIAKKLAENPNIPLNVQTVLTEPQNIKHFVFNLAKNPGLTDETYDKLVEFSPEMIADNFSGYSPHHGPSRAPLPYNRHVQLKFIDVIRDPTHDSENRDLIRNMRTLGIFASGNLHPDAQKRLLELEKSTAEGDQGVADRLLYKHIRTTLASNSSLTSESQQKILGQIGQTGDPHYDSALYQALVFNHKIAPEVQHKIVDSYIKKTPPFAVADAMRQRDQYAKPIDGLAVNPNLDPTLQLPIAEIALDEVAAYQPSNPNAAKPTTLPHLVARDTLTPETQALILSEIPRMGYDSPAPPSVARIMENAVGYLVCIKNPSPETQKYFWDKIAPDLANEADRPRHKWIISEMLSNPAWDSYKDKLLAHPFIDYDYMDPF
jgi:hypothetical protein